MAKDNRSCVYMHKNKINGKIYIGQTVNRRSRWSPISYKNSSIFYNAINKYGWDNFEHIILQDNLTYNQADNYEKYYIQYFNTTNPEFGYNIKLGGTEGYTHSDSTKQKIRESNKKFYINHQEEYALKLNKMHEKAKRKILCINTGEIFNSLTEAAIYANLKHPAPIIRCAKGERKTAGVHPVTKERLVWKYYEDKKEK